MRGLEWTAHAKSKLREHYLSESKVKRVINFPDRIETGIAPKTVAVMKTAGSSKNKYEIWALLYDADEARKVISAWKYPGVTKPGEPLPQSILTEFRLNGVVM